MASAGIVLCADDYGIAPGVSRAIRDLLERGRLSATSCMVVSPDFAAEGPRLKPYLDRADIGLHLTLTQDRPLGALMRAAYLGRLDRQAIGAEIDRQVERFTRVLGRAPDFIDGHQHVHLLPAVREPVLEAAKKIGAYLRLTDEPVEEPPARFAQGWREAGLPDGNNWTLAHGETRTLLLRGGD